MGYDWSSFTKNIPVKAGREEIYHAFASRDGIESWFLRSSEYRDNNGRLINSNEPVQKNFTYSWLWHGYPDEVNEKGIIISADQPNYFAFTFNGNGANEMKVAVTIEEQAGERIVSLRQYDIPTDEESRHHFHVGCMEGWTFYLANLKSILEGGIDLRNKNPLIKKVINS
jgi:uncharacterized protein YndB with AHSA1/START domain